MNRFSIVRAETAGFSVRRLCRLLQVSTSGYYAWRGRVPSKRTQAEERLVTHMRAIHARTFRAYGSPRMTEELRSKGEHVGRHRVARLMRKHALAAQSKKRFTHTTHSNHTFGFAPNTLARRFEAAAPNRVWVSDITYLKMTCGFCYLSVVIDLYSRAVVGYSVDADLSAAGALRALRYALAVRRPQRGLVHHSDRGCQYASDGYQAALRDAGVIASMSRKGNCWDNAPAESFFASLKKERIRNEVFVSVHDARSAVTEYVDGFYNPRRRHTNNAGLSPFRQEEIHARESKPQPSRLPS